MIISNNIGGLSNRIRCIVSCIRYAKKNNINYGVYWLVIDSYKTHKHILNCSFDKLFSNDFEVKNINSNNTYKHHCFIIFDDDNLPINFNTFDSNCSRKFTKSDKLNRNIDFMYNKIPEKIRSEYINYFKILKPIDVLQNKIDDFSKNFTINTISVHIRSWNRNAEESRRNYLFDINRFEKKMNEYDNKYNFYLASDSYGVINYFKTESPLKDRIIIYPRKTNLDTSRDIQEGIQEDLIELYLLSKNNIIIGSHFSTYTEVAWWLGGCPENIIIL